MRPALPSRWILAPAIGAALLLGAWLRLSGLERKIYWYDEVATLLSVAGRTRADVRALRDGAPLRAEELRRLFQEPGHDAGATLTALVADEPHSPPLYFMLARAAALQLGSTGPRAASALAGLGVLVVIGLLARELFDDGLAGWLAAALAAVSPLHVRYAQEARPYALWALALTVASLLLLRALRTHAWRDWLLYALAATTALYTHLFSAFVLVAHAWVAAVAARGAAARTVAAGVPRAGEWLRPIVAFGSPALLFAPWAAAILLHRDTAHAATAWAEAPLPLAEMVHRWVGVVTAVFLRSGAEGGLLGGSSDPAIVTARAALAGAVLALLVASARCLVRETPGRTWAFVALLGAVPALGLALPDLLLGGRRSVILRYLVPCWIAAELAVAGLLARRLRGSNDPRRAAWTCVALALLLAGGASSFAAAPMRTWWDTNPPGLRATLEAARIVNAVQPACVATDVEPLRLLVLVGELGGDVQVLVVGPAQAAAGNGGRPPLHRIEPAADLFFYDPSPELLRAALAADPSLAPCLDASGVRLWCPGSRLPGGHAAE